MRKIRAYLLETVEEQWQDEVIHGPSTLPVSSAANPTRSSWPPIEQAAVEDF
jgi:hypothetical protein